MADLVQYAAARLYRYCVHKGGNGTVRKLPAEVQNHQRDGNCSESIGKAQPCDMEIRPEPRCAEPDKDGDGRPDVRGKVERVCFERLAPIFVCDGHQLARSPQINSDGKGENEQRPEGVANHHRVEKDADDRLIGNPDTGGQHEKCLDECRDILYLSVTIRMVLFRWFIGDADRKKCESSPGKIDPRMCRIR